jgi:hypothetical protein
LYQTQAWRANLIAPNGRRIDQKRKMARALLACGFAAGQ